MPLQWRLQVLEADIAKRFPAEKIRFVEATLFGLKEPERTIALDALTSTADLPFVILGETMISTGKLDADAIAEGIARTLAEGAGK